MKKHIVIGILSLFFLPYTFVHAAVETKHEIGSGTRVLEDVSVPMRDGIELKANVFLPEAQGKFGVIIMRTPYGKGDRKSEEDCEFLL